jgi:PAS domain S-box-containing protein
MRIPTRYVGGILVAAIIPASVIGALGLVILHRGSKPVVNMSAVALIDATRKQASALATTNATKISLFLSDYERDVRSHQIQLQLAISNYPKLNAPYLTDLYQDKDRAGLPGYGYVSPKYGAFANWDHREYAGTAWIRHGVVDRVRSDAAFREKMTQRMHQMMSIVPAFMGAYERHRDSCELLWVVTNIGFDCSYPVDYEKYLIRNPGMNELDESTESYVKDFGPEKNPKHEVRWSKPYVDYIKQKWMISCVAPLYENGEFIGTTGIDVLLGAFTEWLQRLQIGLGGYAFLVSEEGIPLALPERGILDLAWTDEQRTALRTSLANAYTSTNTADELAAIRFPLQNHPEQIVKHALEDMMRGSTQNVVLKLSGENKLLAYAPIKETAWRLGVVIPVSEISEPIQRVREQLSETLRQALVLFLTITTITAALAAILGSYFGYRTTKPILRLISAIDTVGLGGDWHEVSSSTKDELQRLAESVNRMVRAILERELRFELIFDRVNDALFIQDAVTGEILDVNSRMTEMYGYTREEARRVSVTELSSGIAPYSSNEAIDLWSRARAGEHPIFEWHARNKHGDLFWVEVNMRCASIAGRECLIVVVRDIEERIKARAALSEEKERLLVTLQSIGDAVIATDGDGKIALMNQVAQDLTGWPLHEAIGKPLAMVFPIFRQVSGPQCADPALQVLRSEKTVKLDPDTWLETRNGTKLRVADSAAPIRDNLGHVTGVVLVFRDVTGEYKLSQEIQRIAKLESLSVMASGIAHDFNNLLAAISGNVSLAQTFIAERSYADADECLNEAVRASNRANALSTQLLSFAKGNAPVRRVIDIVQLIRESVGIALTGSMCRGDITVKGEIWPIEADPGQLSQVLNNLLINARQAMPDGGTIQVDVENVDLDAITTLPLSGGSYVQITVSDHGVGIPSEVLGNIFDPFFTTKPKGNGLGLASVHSIIRNHSGHVDVSSTIGMGSTFRLLLPALPFSVRPTETAELTEIVNAPWRILVLDDEDMISSMLRRMLEVKGHHAEIVRDGRDVLPLWQAAAAAGRPFDLAILDLTIPGGMGGKEAVAALRHFYPDVKAIAYSGYANDSVLAQFEKFGFSAYIPKPFKAKDIFLAIAELQKNK